MTNDQLGKALVSSGLLPVGEVKSLWSAIPAEQRPKDAKSFAELLIAQGKLTKFQATELLSGTNTPLILGDYQLLAKIGAGGMGQVFKAQHRHMKRTVAIKLLPAELTKDEGAIKRFQREVEAAAKLSHPNIVQAFDASTQRGVWYLVMEYVEGRDLAGIVAAEGSLPIPRAVNFIRQSARGLGFAHENGVVHRDIKPANLLLDKKGTVKILDMGLARFDDGAAQEGLTQSGQVMGTVDYMAPEQAFDTRHADARADVYSLGCTLFRLLTAQNMYEGESLVQKLMGHQSKPIPKLSKFRPDVSPQLEAIFERMVAKDPKERYQTMAEVMQALAPFEDPGKADDGGGLTAHFEGIGAGTATNAALLAEQTAAFVVPTSVNPTVSINNPLQSTDPVSARSIQIARENKPRPLSRAKKPPIWKQPLVLIVGGVGGLLITLLSIWVIIKDKDGKEVARVQVPEGGSTIVQEVPKQVPATNKISTSNNDPTRWPFDPADGKEYVWSEPENLGPSVNTAKDEQMPTLTADELRLVFRNENGTSEKSGLAECVRSSSSEPFKPQAQLTGAAYEFEPALSADGLTLLYDSHAVPNGRNAKDIRIRQRTTLDAPWGKPETISFDGDHDEQTPWLSPDGLTLMYASKRPNSVAESRDLWLVRRKSITEPFGASESLGNDINSDKSDLGGQLFDRERIVFYQRDGKARLTVKAKVGSNFTQHHDLPEYVRGGWLSADGLRLYFHSKTLSGGFGGDDIWVTRRVPKSETALVNSALQFDGDDVVELPTLKFIPRGSYTLEGYITAPVKTDKGAGLAFGMPQQSYLSFTRLGDWRWVYVPHSGGDKGREVSIAGAAARPERTHIACVRDGNSHRLYVDGKLFHKTADILSPTAGTSPFQIGSEFRGIIDELRVSKIARYKSDFSPAARLMSDADTLGLYHFDEGTGDVLNDSSGNNHRGKIVGAKWVRVENTDQQREAIEWLLSMKAQVGVGPIVGREYITSYAEYQSKNKPVCEVQFDNPAVTDQDLARLLLFPEILLVNLSRSSIGDVGVSHLAKLPKLTTLNMQELNVTDKSLVELQKLQNLSELYITKCRQLTDGATLARLPKLTMLNAAHTGLGDEGIQKLADSNSLAILSLFGNHVTDAAVPHLSRMKSLKTLGAQRTGLTAAGVKQLAAALPQCEIHSDYGTFQPTQAASSTAAQPQGDYALRTPTPGSLAAGQGVTIPTLKLPARGPYTVETRFTPLDKEYGRLYWIAYQLNLELDPESKLNIFAKGRTASGKDNQSPRGTTTFPLVPGQSYHIAAVRTKDESQFQLYVDGKLAASCEAIILGSDPFVFGTIAGEFDELRVSKIARYEKDFTPAMRFDPDADTLALYHMDEGTGDVLNDSSGNNHHGKIVGAKWVKVAAAPTPANAVVYLDDLQEIEWKTITNNPLGKHGKYFDQGATKETAIIFRGKPVAHSLWMHPPFSGDRTGFARYQLDGRYTTFAAEAGVTENSNIDPQSPITFRVLGDGRELWKSPPLQKRGESAAVSVDVRGVKELRLEAACEDKNGNCHAVWFMPRLTTVAGTVKTIPAEALTFNGHRYLLVDSEGVWDQARADAEALGGHLATINSKEERDWIRENIIRKRSDARGSTWLGGISDNGTYNWITGEPFDKSLWLGTPTDAKNGRSNLCWILEDHWNGEWPHARVKYQLVEWDTLGPTISTTVLAPPSDAGPPIDLLPLVRVAKPTKSEAWKRDAQGIVIPGDGFARTQIDAAVPDEYELQIDAVPLSGSKSLMIGLSRAGKRFWIPVSGWNAAHTKLEPPPTNGTGQVESRALRLTENRPVKLVCTVWRGGVKLVGDGLTLIDWRGDTTSLPSEWDIWALPEPEKLALGSWEGEIRVTRLELRPLLATKTGTAPPLAKAPFTTAQAKAHQQAWAKYLGVPVEFTNKVGMKFRLIPPGEFQMGLGPEFTDAELQRLLGVEKDDDLKTLYFARPAHPVRITRPFYMEVEEITSGHYRDIIGQLRPEMEQNPNKAANSGITFLDAIAFCNKLSEREGKRPAYRIEGEKITPIDDADGYRLPTEAQWEYACRAGTNTFWYFGNDGGLDNIEFKKRCADPNPFGLTGLYAGSNEWCWDGTIRGGSPYPAALLSRRDDPREDEGAVRIKRGGSGKDSGGADRRKVNSFARGMFSATETSLYSGLGRVVLPIQLPPQVVAPQSAAPPPVPAAATGTPGGVGLILFIGDLGAEAPTPALDTQKPWTAEVYLTPLTENLANNTCGIIGSDQGFGFGVRDGKYLGYSFHGETSGGTVKAGERVHLACVQTATKRMLFVNGKLVGSTDNPFPTEKKPVGKILFSLANNIPNQPPIDVRVQGLRVSQSVRYITDFTPPGRHTPDKDTLVLFHLDEGQGTTLTDSSGNNLHGKIINAKWGMDPPIVPTSSKLWMHDPAFAQWVKDVQALPAEKQLEAVSKKLMELNPGFDGKFLHSLAAEPKPSLQFYTDNVSDISPVRAIGGLKSLICPGSDPGKGALVDLSPLEGIGIESLDLSSCPKITNLAPLKGMPLQVLKIVGTRVTDLTPLQEMPLKRLEIHYTPVKDLGPLRKLPLNTLVCFETQVADLSPLGECRELTRLILADNKLMREQAATLQKALPNCSMEWRNPDTGITIPK